MRFEREACSSLVYLYGFSMHACGGSIRFLMVVFFALSVKIWMLMHISLSFHLFAARLGHHQPFLFSPCKFINLN